MADCKHRWVIESPGKGKAWLRGVCKRCGATGQYRAALKEGQTWQEAAAAWGKAPLESWRQSAAAEP